MLESSIHSIYDILAKKNPPLLQFIQSRVGIDQWISIIFINLPAHNININMAVYLSFLEHTKHSQQIIEKPSFMSKHKISINNPVQAHYTVEGVQSYAP